MHDELVKMRGVVAPLRLRPGMLLALPMPRRVAAPAPAPAPWVEDDDASGAFPRSASYKGTSSRDTIMNVARPTMTAPSLPRQVL